MSRLFFFFLLLRRIVETNSAVRPEVDLPVIAHQSAIVNAGHVDCFESFRAVLGNTVGCCRKLDILASVEGRCVSEFGFQIPNVHKHVWRRGIDDLDKPVGFLVVKPFDTST